MKPRHADPRGRILAVIRTSVKERGYPPSMREIASACGFTSTGTVSYHLRAMAADGLIRRVPGAARAVVIADIHPASSEAVPDAPGTASDPTESETTR